MHAVTKPAQSDRTIAIRGDRLPTMDAFADIAAPSHGADVTVVGIDARHVSSKSAFITLLRRRKRAILGPHNYGSHIVAVVSCAVPAEPWMHHSLHRWALSIHRHLQQARGADTDVTALLVDWRTSAALVAERISELARRPSGLNPAAVLEAEEICGRTITQASTDDIL